MKFLPFLAAVTAAVPAPPPSSPWTERLAFWVVSELRQTDTRLRQIENELHSLASPALVNSSIRIGFKTGYTTEEDVRWLELELPQATLADTLVFVPPLAKGATAVVQGYGFPVRFKVEVFDALGQPHTVLDHTQDDFPNPGCYPVIARFAPRTIKRARFTATEPWIADGPEVLAMAEVYLLSGTQNLAPEAKVNTSSTRNAPRAWTRSNLTDLATPLGLPVAPQVGGPSGFHSAVATNPDEPKWLTLELPEALPLDEVRLIPVRRPEVPLWFDYGFPVLYKLEAAQLPDFSDAVTLQEVTDRLTPTPGMNPVLIPCKKTLARYLRLTATQLWYRRSDYVFALAEFQAYHQGQNIAPTGHFTASDRLTGPESTDWSLDALKDGVTGQSRLLELPEWFQQLTRHQSLTSEQSTLLSKRATLVEKAETRLIQSSVGTAGLITLLSLGLLWRQRHQRKKDAEKIRERLARDLHDEIGSNLGSITLICSMAAQPGGTLESLRGDLAEIERVAEESADSMRDIVRIIQPQPKTGAANWISVLENLTERLLRSHELDLALPATPLTHKPDPETRREIYLFCKEVLHNIARHAQATRVTFHLIPSPNGLHITLTDNGVGFDPKTETPGHGLGNLKARAAALHGRLSLRSVLGQGTTIHLDIPATRHWTARPPPRKQA